jgi:TolA-binding protein
VKALLVATLLLATAPYQCASDSSDRPIEDTAPQALWILAERFANEGNAEARRTTLEQIIDQYPSSRYAQRARQELGVTDPGKPSAESP